MTRSTVAEFCLSVMTTLLIVAGLYVAWTSVVSLLLVELSHVVVFQLVGFWCLLPFLVLLAGQQLLPRSAASKFILCLVAMMLAGTSVVGYAGGPARHSVRRWALFDFGPASDASVNVGAIMLVALGQTGLVIVGLALARFVGSGERQSFEPDNHNVQLTPASMERRR